MKFSIFTPDGFLCYETVRSWEVSRFLAEIASAFQCVVTMDLYSKRIELL